MKTHKKTLAVLMILFISITPSQAQTNPLEAILTADTKYYFKDGEVIHCELRIKNNGTCDLHDLYIYFGKGPLDNRSYFPEIHLIITEEGQLHLVDQQLNLAVGNQISQKLTYKVTEEDIKQDSLELAIYIKATPVIDGTKAENIATTVSLKLHKMPFYKHPVVIIAGILLLVSFLFFLNQHKHLKAKKRL